MPADLCGNTRVVDVGTDGVQWYGTERFFFAAGHICAVQSSGNFDTNTFGTGAHGSGAGALDGAAETHTALNLVSDVLGNQLCEKVRLFDLVDVDAHWYAVDFLDSCFQFLCALAAAADDDTGFSGSNGNSY